ncbi:hypothetical protein PS691_01902 [Pseudomonas fluorescens]|uniref:Uncharacterized protein n=1 Tax=Pseudomonas fluorescens TaxID=294 RepID=A0A5E7C6B5_PSEFL|nr:hypothetical protein PS691_01902 [Pseudomonas fluorescens]
MIYKIPPRLRQSLQPCIQSRFFFPREKRYACLLLLQRNPARRTVSVRLFGRGWVPHHEGVGRRSRGGCRGRCARTRTDCTGRGCLCAGGTRPDAGAAGLVPGFVTGPGTNGGDLSGRCRRRRGLVQGASGQQRRRRRASSRERALGPERAIAGRLPGSAGDPGPGSGLGAARGRCLPRAAQRRDGFSATPAPASASRRPPRIQRATENHRAAGCAGTGQFDRGGAAACRHADHHH